VKQEIEKTMQQVRLPSRAFRLWRDSGALASLIPALAGITDLQLAALDHLRIPGLPGRPQRKVARLTGLFAAADPREITQTLKALRFSNTDVKWIAGIVAIGRELSGEMTVSLIQEAEPPDAALRRWAAIAGRTRLASVLRLADAMWWAEREAGLPAPSRQRVSSVYRRAIRIAYRDPIEIADLGLTGGDLERIGISGPAVGRTLRWLVQEVINNPALNTHERLLAMARGEAATSDDSSSGPPGPSESR
jgi:hypothetical protein